jgi:hypothetical protein
MVLFKVEAIEFQHGKKGNGHDEEKEKDRVEITRQKIKKGNKHQGGVDPLGIEAFWGFSVIQV